MLSDIGASSYRYVTDANKPSTSSAHRASGGDLSTLAAALRLIQYCQEQISEFGN